VYFCILCFIVVPLPPGKTPLTVQLNNNNNNTIMILSLLSLRRYIAIVNVTKFLVPQSDNYLDYKRLML
jgi:hypothetical protein